MLAIQLVCLQWNIHYSAVTTRGQSLAARPRPAPPQHVIIAANTCYLVTATLHRAYIMMMRVVEAKKIIHLDTMWL